MKVEVKELELDDYEFQWTDTNTYKNKGLFLIKDKESNRSDFVFFGGDFVLAICPLDMFKKSIQHDNSHSEESELTQEDITYGNDFILEFARILLNRK